MSKRDVQYKILISVSVICASYYGATFVLPYLVHLLNLSKEKRDTLKRIKGRLDKSRHDREGRGADGDGGQIDSAGNAVEAPAMDRKTSTYASFFQRFSPFKLNVKARGGERISEDSVDVVSAASAPEKVYKLNPYQLKVPRSRNIGGDDANSGSSAKEGTATATAAMMASPASARGKSYESSRPRDVKTYQSHSDQNTAIVPAAPKKTQDTIVSQQDREYMKSLQVDREKEAKRKALMTKQQLKERRIEKFYERKRQLQEIQQNSTNNKDDNNDTNSTNESIVIRFNIRSETSSDLTTFEGTPVAAAVMNKVTKKLASNSTVDDVMDCVEALPELPFYTSIEVSSVYPKVVLQRSSEVSGPSLSLRDVVGAGTKNTVIHVHTIDESGSNE